MPRPKPKKAQPNFTAHPHLLSETAKVALVELLGRGDFSPLEESIRHQLPGTKILTAAPGAPILLESNSDTQVSARTSDIGKAIRDVETWLGFFVNAAYHLDETPRPADYAAAFESLGKDAAKVLRRLTSLTGYFRDQFKLKGADIYAVENALAALLGVSKSVLKEMKALSSKGARKNAALAEVIRQLRGIFRDNYQGLRTGRIRRGAFQFRTEEEKRELAFVRTALLDARAISEGYRELPRLFRDPRCQPPMSKEPYRSAEIERIADRVDRERTREQKKNDS